MLTSAAVALCVSRVCAAVAPLSISDHPLLDEVPSPSPNPRLEIMMHPTGASLASLPVVSVPSGRERTSIHAGVERNTAPDMPPTQGSAMGRNHDPNATANPETSADAKLSVLAVGVVGIALACHYWDYL
ncbi:hypothetical protein C8Q76DRAFT_798243 [Earliella scabrosa]|nr:hypothetical protein C8Q76DRAFT_798243 [Earliella scabrosa]